MRLLAAAYVGLFAIVAAGVLAVWYADQQEPPAPPVTVSLPPPAREMPGAQASSAPPPAAMEPAPVPGPAVERTAAGDAVDDAAAAPEPATDGPAPRVEIALAPVEQALLEDGRDGPLPRIGPDGRQPWQVYARPFTGPARRPRVAIVVHRLGLSGALTERAIHELPGEVTLAFSPYARDLAGLAARARKAGHETLAAVTMEPGEPTAHPGPHVLRGSEPLAQNEAELKWFLARFAGYVGVLSEHGQRFTASAETLRPLLDELRSRGLMFVDGGTTEASVTPELARALELPFAVADIRVGHELARAAIDAQLLEAEVIARLKGAAVVIAQPHAIVIDRLLRWIPDAERNGMTIAPITAVANRQKLR